MWVGRGANGKGALARTLHYVFGDYADAPSDALYMRTKMGGARSDAARPDLLRLMARRFTYMSEPHGGQFNEELLKAHTGEDMILARNLYGRAEQMASFPPTHKIVFLTNNPPKTDDVGISMSRRVRLVMFEQDYSQRMDKTLEERLKAEKQGILAIAVREALAYISEGMPEPQKVTDWSTEYIEENDPLGPFIVERCSTMAKDSSTGSALYAAFEDWTARRDDAPDMSQTGFGLALKKRFKAKRAARGVVYSGVRPLSAVELADRGDDD
jgi:putative DNA primase/helicase